jgi:hypothetical protein
MTYGDVLVVSLGVLFEVLALLFAVGERSFCLLYLFYLLLCFFRLVARVLAGLRSASRHHFKLAI